ncbi:MarR family winged helix-turn-helix transcriptional regulator [Aestuariispira insulae]|uniref:DNA-binding MarR family transcriptional regulator n=1 Tax=Aestuariispira insulae TaxID=1461337 RepID=A0A3D9HVA5_9PROT|nr:MarR family winged helix-turn-helix transcriptional regulator [Aestuariispira insulae]RED53387.1 DNA-binding MarR family transcriptional regulator [Aestuariispira insulae]
MNQTVEENNLGLKDDYLNAIRLIERLHRQFLEVVKGEIDRLGVRDINNIQALILYNIGDDELTVGELTHRGYYLGSNVSYNVRKMVENGYLIQERSTHDRRSIRVRLSDKGKDVRDKVNEILELQSDKLAETGINSEQLQYTGAVLNRLERFLLHTFGYGPAR